MSENRASIVMEDISFQYGSKTVLNHFNLTIESGKIYALIGSSGSGKTTTLRLMNGLLEPLSGKLLMDGKEFDYKKSEKWRRSMGYSIQGSGLFPHMTIEENLSIIARKEAWPKNKIQQRIEELCELVNLPKDPSFLRKKPRQISGGQQQRVGIARALFMSPKIILMDEPFSALDPITRSEIQNEFLALQKKLNLTIVIVTHDLPEAFAMAHEIVLLNDGKIEQKAKPSCFLLQPETEYVEKFMKSHSPGNLLKEIYLYSVINTDIFLSTKEEPLKLTHLDSLAIHQFSDEHQRQEFLLKHGQDQIYCVNQKGHFLECLPLNNNETIPSAKLSLKDTDHILTGMKTIISSQRTIIPVVNDGRMVGVFSKGALDAL